jgi:hypothetical protein
MELAPNLAAAGSNMLLTMHYGSEVDPAELAVEHWRWGCTHAARHGQPGFSEPARPGRRLRLGYLSPDIRQHSVAFFLEPLDHRDRAGFEVFGYGDVKTPDEVTQRLKSKMDQYRSTIELRDPQIVDMIRRTRWTSWSCRSRRVAATVVLAWKPAPVQLTTAATRTPPASKPWTTADRLDRRSPGWRATT